MSLFDELESGAREVVGRCLHPVQFAKGQCLMRAGEPGDGCYLIDDGVVRLELHQTDTDSERVLCHLEAGAVLGEFSLLDGQPRSASAYADTDTRARWLSRSDFDRTCVERPDVGVQLLTALGRQLTTKLRQQNNQVAEHIFGEEADRDTNEMVARAVAAQREFAAWPEERVDALLRDVASAIAASAVELAEANVSESGIGVAADKVVKIRFSCDQVFESLAGRQAIGVLRDDATRGVCEIAAPMGVVLGIIPVTNPVSTIAFKTIIALKSRNALILSCHRDAMKVGDMTGRLVLAALERHGAPADLVQWIRSRTDRRKTAMLMQHPDVALILATGGPSIVEAAYSSGTPAIGVGAGNAPVLICGDADLAAAALRVVGGKSFDNGVICGSENNLVVVESVAGEFVRHLEAQGAAVLTADEIHRLTAVAFEAEHGGLRRDVVGKSAAFLAERAGISRRHPIRLLVAHVPREEVRGPYGHEKLAPILSLFTVPDVEAGFAFCQCVLEQQGIGHTAIIHTGSEEAARRFGLEMPASRVLVNVDGSGGCIGLGTGLTPSLTLGCGSFGGNSTSDNVTYSHLLNIKRLARGREAGQA